MPSWTLHQGEALSVLATLPDASADAVITDPPYSSGGAFRGDRALPTNRKYEQTGIKRPRLPFSGDAKDQRSWMRWCREWLSECRRIARPGAPLCVFTDWRQLPAITDAVQGADWVWRGIAVWDKTEGSRAPGPGRFRHQCEYVVFATNGPMHSRCTEVGVLPGVLRQAVLQKDKHHLTGKPTAVMAWLIKIVVPDGLVLDPFAGSGTTGVSALRAGRAFIGIEREPAYCEIARKRLEAACPAPAS